jgi:DNA-binding MarR family transcriptional regulator
MRDDTERPSESDVVAWARLVRVSQDLIGRVEGELKTAGFPPLSWYDALLELRRADAAGLRPFQLQSEMLLAQYNMSRLVSRLAAAGHIERLPSDHDRRGQVLRITAKGRRLLREMWPVYRAAIAKHFARKLSEPEALRLARLLAKLRED